MRDGHDETAAFAAVESQLVLATPGGAGLDRNPPLRIHPRTGRDQHAKKPDADMQVKFDYR
jgi:hypothetical protein